MAAVAVVAVAVAAMLAGCEPASADAALAAGNASHAKGDYKAAVQAFSRAVRELQGEPQAAQARLLLGQALLDSGDAGAAAVAYSQALDGGAPAAQGVPALARAMGLAGQSRKLVTLYGELSFAEDPGATASLKTSVAAAWGALADAAKTQVAIRDALVALPDHAPAQVLQAAIGAGRGDLQTSGQETDALLAAHPRLASAWMLKGEIDWQRDRTAEAATAFHQAFAIEPALMPAGLALVGLALQRGDVVAAKAALQLMLERQPAHPLTRYAQAQLACFEGDYGRARDLTQELLRSAPEQPGVLLLAAVAEAHIGSLVIADSQLAKALQIEPQSTPVRLDLAQVQLQRGQAAPALQTLAPLLQAEGSVQSQAWAPAQTRAQAQVQTKAQAKAQALAGAAELQLGHRQAAVQRLQQAAATEPANAAYATEAVLARLDPTDPHAMAAVLAALRALSATTQGAQPDRALVLLHLQRHDLAAAAAALQTLARKQPGAAALSGLRARLLLERAGAEVGDRSAAQTALQQALQIDPRSVAATAALARIDLLDGHPQAAVQRLETLVAAEPQNTTARLALAAFQIRSGDVPDSARSTLAAAIRRAPTAAEPRLMLIELLLAHHQGRAALDLAQQSLVALPDEPSVLEAAGRAQLHSGAVEQAINSFGRLLALAPNLATPHALLGDALRRSGQTDAAEAAYRKALALDPQSRAARLGLMQLLRQTAARPRELIALAQQQQQAAPADSASYLAEAQAWLQLKDPAAAGAVYQRGIAADADAPRLARTWFADLQQQGRSGEAQRFGLQWLATHPDDSAFEFELASAALARQDWPRAETHLAAVLAQRSDDALALNNLAWTLLMQGKPGALQAAQRAADQLPNRADVLDTLALALAADGEPDQALLTQRAAVRLAPGDDRLRLGLARVALQAGDKILARHELRRLKDLGAGFTGQADVARLWHQL